MPFTKHHNQTKNINSLSATVYISKILETSARSHYALRILKSQGMLAAALHEVARATTMANTISATM